MRTTAGCRRVYSLQALVPSFENCAKALIFQAYLLSAVQTLHPPGGAVNLLVVEQGRVKPIFALIASILRLLLTGTAHWDDYNGVQPFFIGRFLIFLIPPDPANLL